MNFQRDRGYFVIIRGKNKSFCNSRTEMQGLRIQYPMAKVKVFTSEAKAKGFILKKKPRMSESVSNRGVPPRPIVQRAERPKPKNSTNYGGREKSFTSTRERSQSTNNSRNSVQSNSKFPSSNRRLQSTKNKDSRNSVQSNSRFTSSNQRFKPTNKSRNSGQSNSSFNNSVPISGLFGKSNLRKTVDSLRAKKIGNSNYGQPSNTGERKNRKRKRVYLKKPVSKIRLFSEDISKTVWNEKQKKVLAYVRKKKNVFFTGGGGTGKSHLIQKIYLDCTKMYGPEAVFITATTGISAVNIQGQTINRFSGIGRFSEDNFDKMLASAQKKEWQWRRCRALIIDEISMLSSGLFDALERIARIVRGNHLPFGGLQVIVTGDFFQLPPVRGGFCFNAKTWKTVIEKNCVNLTKIYRQKDSKFVSILNCIRCGIITPYIKNVLSATVRPLSMMDGIEPTRLYSVNVKVNEINGDRLKKIKGRTVTYESIDFCDGGPSLQRKMKNTLDNTQAVECLELKKGAQVILTRNVSELLANGSRGKIIDFKRPTDKIDLYNEIFEKKEKKKGWKEEQEGYIHEFYKKKSEHNKIPVVLFSNGLTAEIPPEVFMVENNQGKCMRVQIPLKLAWALTIHKCQGLSIDKVEISMENMFCCGHFYVALSRVRTLKGLCLKKFDPSQIRADKRVVEFMESCFPGFIEETKKEMMKLPKMKMVPKKVKLEKRVKPKKKRRKVMGKISTL